MILSIDPGAAKPHAVVQWVGDRLIWVGMLVPDQVWDRASAPPEAVVIESQQVYGRDGAQKAKSLIKLAQAAGDVVGRLQPTKVCWVLPTEWKGQTPKPTKLGQPYVVERLVRACLNEAEIIALNRAVVENPGARMDLIDAVGIGLYYLRREGWPWGLRRAA
jgi:hypothetical protein